MDNTTITNQNFSSSKQQQIDRLVEKADRLFLLGKVREYCVKYLVSIHEGIQSSPFSDWGKSHRDDCKYLFAWHLTMSYRSTMDKIVKWAGGCVSEYLLIEMREQRKQKIEEFAKLKITSRWYQMKDDDTGWRVFSNNIPFNMPDREVEVYEFFECLDYISIYTDILMGYAKEYGLEVDYSKLTQPNEDAESSQCQNKKNMSFPYQTGSVVKAIQAQTEVLKKIAEQPRTQNNLTIELVQKKETNIDKNYGPNIENNGTLSLPDKDMAQ